MRPFLANVRDGLGEFSKPYSKFAHSDLKSRYDVVTGGGAMASKYLNSLSEKERAELVQTLWVSQKGKCFISGDPIDLNLHAEELDVDHIEPSAHGGKDAPENFALTFASWNRRKQASDLRVARVLSSFQKLVDRCNEENRRPNLGDVLTENGGAKHELPLKRENGSVHFTFSPSADHGLHQVPLYDDPLSGQHYFFANLPIEYLHHDDKINPRSIGANVGGLIEEFFKKRPQLHVVLAWCRMDQSGRVRIQVFDGQHKAAAQILLGVRQIPARIFLDPDIDLLLTTNTNAGTTLRQVAFDKSVQRHLGSSLYLDRVQKYQKAHGLKEEDYSFSEEDLVRFFRGENREMRRYIVDAVRDGITNDPENKLRDYIEFAGKGVEKPLSYSTIEKTFYSLLIGQELLETPLGQGMESGDNPRHLERQQIARLLSQIAEEIFIGKFDPDLGTNRIESKVAAGETIPLDHLIACRLGKEQIVYNWVKLMVHIVQAYFINLGQPVQETRLFQYWFPEALWANLTRFLKNFRGLPIWSNTELARTVFGGRQTNSYWRNVFETGKSPDGVPLLSRPLNLMEMIRA